MVERIIDFIYWTVFAVAIVFEISVMVVLFGTIFVFICAAAVLYLLVCLLCSGTYMLLHTVLEMLHSAWCVVTRRSR